jgi:hypothetical protein
MDQSILDNGRKASNMAMARLFYLMALLKKAILRTIYTKVRTLHHQIGTCKEAIEEFKIDLPYKLIHLISIKHIRKL